jgi:phosphoribosylanthranilate isomerase
LLRHYTGKTPFLLSGGIGEESLCALKTVTHPAWAGVDLNSRFEVSPGKKNIPAIKRFIEELNNSKNDYEQN